MNTATGNSAFKIHLVRGSMTACNRKMSVGKVETDSFRRYLELNPDMLCKKCLSEYNRLLARKTKVLVIVENK